MPGRWGVVSFVCVCIYVFVLYVSTCVDFYGVCFIGKMERKNNSVMMKHFISDVPGPKLG